MRKDEAMKKLDQAIDLLEQAHHEYFKNSIEQHDIYLDDMICDAIECLSR